MNSSSNSLSPLIPPSSNSSVQRSSVRERNDSHTITETAVSASSRSNDSNEYHRGSSVSNTSVNSADLSQFVTQNQARLNEIIKSMMELLSDTKTFRDRFLQRQRARAARMSSNAVIRRDVSNLEARMPPLPPRPLSVSGNLANASSKSATSQQRETFPLRTESEIDEDELANPDDFDKRFQGIVNKKTGRN
jgi:hypothetical protein